MEDRLGTQHLTTGSTPSTTGSLVARCAAYAREEHIGPAGTAGRAHGFLLVELLLPWPREITDHPVIAPAAEALAGAGLRVQAVVPRPGSAPERRQVVHMVRPAGAFARYVSTPFVASEDELPRVVADLATAGAPTTPPTEGAGAGRSADREPTTPGGSGPPPGVVGPVAPTDRHVLVCTHGRRDACCGTLGTRVSLALPGLGGGVHVWRTSHTGGHRFAPTALLLPEGTAWAYLDPERLTAIVDRTLDPATAADLYRGCTGLDDIEVQAADGELLRTQGWEWLDHARTGRVLARRGNSTRVEIEGRSPDGHVARFEATVEVVRTLPVPDCGRPPTEARKSAPELRVTELTAA